MFILPLCPQKPGQYKCVTRRLSIDWGSGKTPPAGNIPAEPRRLSGNYAKTKGTASGDALIDAGDGLASEREEGPLGGKAKSRGRSGGGGDRLGCPRGKQGHALSCTGKVDRSAEAWQDRELVREENCAFM